MIIVASDDEFYTEQLQTELQHLPKLILISCAGGRHNMPRPCKLTFDLYIFIFIHRKR